MSSVSHPGTLSATSEIGDIKLSWPPPASGAIATYNIYRCTVPFSGTGCPAANLWVRNIPGGIPAPTFTDTVNDFTDSGGGCPVTGSTCYNTTYYYSVTAVVAVTGYPNTESTATNTMSGIVKHLFVTANNKNRPYGSANPTLDYSFTGLDNSLATGPYAITCTTTATIANPVGTYPITCGPPPGTTSDPTDGITYTAGTLTITPAALTIAAKNQVKTYGSTFTFAGTEFTITGTLYNGDAVTSVTLTSAGAAPTATVAGSPYPITPSLAAGTGLANYIISYVTGTLTVNPARLTITAKNQSKTYGSTFTFAGTEFTVTGALYNADAVRSLTLTSAGAVAAATVGAYPIVPSAAVGSGLKNYAISYVNGTLTVVGYTFTLTPPKSPAQLGSSVPVNWTLQNASGEYIVDLSTVTEVDSIFNGSAPPGGCLASVTGSSLILYSPATGAKGNSNLRSINSGFQFNWDTTVNTTTGKGCYTVKVSLKDGTAHATTAVQLK